MVPQSFGTWYSSVGSHHSFLNFSLMYLRFGIRLTSSFWMKPSSTMPGRYSAVGDAMS